MTKKFEGKRQVGIKTGDQLVNTTAQSIHTVMEILKKGRGYTIRLDRGDVSLKTLCRPKWALKSPTAEAKDRKGERLVTVGTVEGSE